MEKEKIIQMLNQDLMDEHAAVIQYLEHAYAMGEGEMACEIEAISREEMRHFDWLAEVIVELGGTINLNRGHMRMGGETVPEWMKNDALLEQDAIRNYEQHIKAIDDPKTKRLLERIVSDERAHLGQFEHFAEKAQKEGLTDLRGPRRDKVTKVLDWGIEHEYTVILQYLYHSYMTPSEEVREEMQDQAINEMQHLGWLAEELVDGGGSPTIEHGAVDQSTKTADMLRADIQIEKEVAAEYDHAAKKVEDPGLKELLTRIRDHEVYHASVFSDLLEEEEA